MTLQACGPQGAFGTLSLRLDSDSGLLADELYHAEVDAYRRAGGRVCELVLFAVEREYGSKEMLAFLFQLIYIYSRRAHRLSDIFVEVNPRHVACYEQWLDFHRVGDSRVCERVGAPAVLLHLDLRHVDEVLALEKDRRGKDSRSLYRYFLSPDEQEGLCRRISAQPHDRGDRSRDLLDPAILMQDACPISSVTRSLSRRRSETLSASDFLG